MNDNPTLCTNCGREREYPATYFGFCADCAEHTPGRRIARLRQERELTQKQLARAIGCSPTTISFIEDGTMRTTVFVGRAIEYLEGNAMGAAHDLSKHNQAELMARWLCDKGIVRWENRYKQWGNHDLYESLEVVGCKWDGYTWVHPKHEEGKQL